MKKLLKIFISLLLSLLFSLSVTIKPTTISAIEQIGSWALTTDLPYNLASHTSLVLSEKIYVINGSAVTGQTHPDILEALVQPDGSLPSWTTVSLLPQPLIWHSTANWNNFVYVLGGFLDGINGVFSSVDTVYLSNGGGGSLNNWSTLTPLPNQLSLGNAVAVGNRIYYAGGFREVPLQSVTYSNKVYVTDVNPDDGTIGSWSPTTDLPAALSGFGMIETGNKIIIIGGFNHNAFQYSDKVLESTVNPNGSLSTWIEKDPLPQPVYRGGVTKIGSTVVLAGGVVAGDTINNVYIAEIDGSSSIGSWSESTNPLPQPICCGALVSTDTHLYYTGGHNTESTAYFNTVYMAPFGEVSEGLNVPDIKQFSTPWGPHKYDNSTSTPNTITRWGCALTSAVMTLRYYNHDVDPDSLNSWLINHSGYNRESGINWASVATFSRQNSQKINLNLPLEHIEWKRYRVHDDTIIDTQLNLNQPVILNVPGHFIVAKGKTDSDYFVNDPASNANNLLSLVEVDHGGQYFKIETYTPNNTDLSYIYLLVDDFINMEIFDPDGNKIEEGYAIETPLTSDDGLNQIIGNPLNSFALPKPQKGFYKILLTGNGNYQVDSYLYDQDGNVNLNSSLRTLQEGETDTYLINLDKINSEESSFSEVSFKSLISDLDKAYNEGKITKRGIYISLRTLVQAAKRSFKNGRTHASKILLNVAKKKIMRLSPRFIEQDIVSYLITKINLLINSL